MLADGSPPVSARKMARDRHPLRRGTDASCSRSKVTKMAPDRVTLVNLSAAPTAMRGGSASLIPVQVFLGVGVGVAHRLGRFILPPFRNLPLLVGGKPGFAVRLAFERRN